MSVLSEEPPTNPQDPLHYAPRRSNPRPELRLSSVSSNVGETPFDRAAKPEPARRAPAPPSSLSAELENAVFESLRRQMDPEVVPEPPTVEGRLWRRAWVGVGAAVAVAAIAATLFVTLAPHDDAAPSFAAAAPASAQEAASKAALAQFRSLIPAENSDQQAVTRDQPTNHDQTASNDPSERLLKRFMLWRQKVDAGDQAH
ncbi:MAG TPA: hypothetical protein VMH36_13235 [Alphaproteobacteria bacterium]|nr:hypothetical protein [Alphaproteobacteria bacterium]